MTWSRDDIACRAAQEVAPGSIVNLGIGMPTLCARYLGDSCWLHSENGVLGVGDYPTPDKVNPLMINAGKETITIRNGGSVFDSAMSFAMVRGGHVDVTIMGAMQVSASGDLANWSVPGGRVMGVGGAMDLAMGCRRTIIMMTHTTKDGKPKLVQDCTYPLTAFGVVDLIVTDLGVFIPDGDKFTVQELAAGVQWDEVQSKTSVPIAR